MAIDNFNALVGLLLLIGLASALPQDNIFGNCISTTDAIYSLPDTILSELNPWLKDDTNFQALTALGCPPTRDAGTLCHDKPGIGSGLAQLSPTLFLSLTDRGPNQDCEDLFELDPHKYAEANGRKGKGFPLTAFAPTIMHLEPDPNSRVLQIRRMVPLRGADGAPISGMPNTDADDTPYGLDCAGKQLPYDRSGLDTEDIARIPGTDYVAMVDEYSPSVVLANYNSGTVINRHVPKKLASALSGTRYKITADIPDVFALRRKNRGFEAIVVDAEARYVIAILQSAMLGGGDDEPEDNAIIRCAYFSLSISQSGIPSLAYDHSFIIEASSPSTFQDPKNDAKDIKYSAAQYHSPSKFVVLERAKGQVKLFLIDFRKATNIDNTRFVDNLDLEKETNGMLLAKQVGITAADKTQIWDSLPGVGGSVDFTGPSKIEGFAIDITDDSKVWFIDDNDFGLENNENVRLYKMSLGRAPTGATVCKLPDHPMTPQINVMPSNTIRLSNPQTFRYSGEIKNFPLTDLDVDEAHELAYVSYDERNNSALDAFKLTENGLLSRNGRYIIKTPFSPTSVSVCRNGPYVAVGLTNSDKPGRVDIINKNLKLVRRVRAGRCIGVIDVKWTDECKFLVAACRGEGPSAPGGVLVIDFAGPKSMRFRGANMADFGSFDSLKRFVRRNGVRFVESEKPSLDFEPKRLAVHGRHAFVTLQTNNAIAVVDIPEAKVTEVKPVGYIQRSRDGFGIDASDKDGKIAIHKYIFLYGMPQPHGIQTYVAGDGETYLVLVNEGAAKESEEARGADITDESGLNRIAVGGLKQLVEDDMALGRLVFSAHMGFNRSSNTQERMYHFGGRSFSIMKLDGSVIFDSGEWLARILEKHFPLIFNSDGFDVEDMSLSQKDLFDGRSDDKGMEPKSVSLMEKGGKTYAFIGLERTSAVVVFDVTDPTTPKFVDAALNHPTDVAAGKLFDIEKQGDIAIESLFASCDLGKLFVIGRASQTATTYDIES